MAITADSFLRMSSKNKVVLAIIVFLVIVGGYYWLSYSAKSDELQQLTRAHAEKTRELNRLEALAAKIVDLQKAIATLDAKFEKAKERVPDKREIPSLLTTISGLARESRLQVLVFKPLPEVMESFFARVPVEISVWGSFHDVALFLDKVSKLPRIVSISNISIDRKEANGRVVVATTGLATTYRFLTEAEIAKVAAEKKAKEAREKKPAVLK